MSPPPPPCSTHFPPAPSLKAPPAPSSSGRGYPLDEDMELLGRQRFPYTKPTDFKNYQEIGAGRSSKVYVATCVRTGRHVVVKANNKQAVMQGNGLQQLRRMSREVVIMNKLRHNNLCGMLAYFQDERYIYIVMEYCVGGDLFALLSKCSGRLSEKTLVLKVRAAPALQARAAGPQASRHPPLDLWVSSLSQPPPPRPSLPPSLAPAHSPRPPSLPPHRSCSPSCGPWSACTARASSTAT